MKVDRISAMSAIDDAENTNSGEYDESRSAGGRHVKLVELDRAAGGRSGDDPRMMLRFKPLSPPLPTAEVGLGRKVGAGEDHDFSATKEKPMFNFQTVAGKMPNAILNNVNSKEDRSSVKVFPSPMETEAIIRPLNSTRKQETGSNAPPPNATGNPRCEKKSTRLRRNCEKVDRAKFSISLSRHEIEKDFIAMTGKKPPGKPKKRPRVVQNQINAAFPGLWLTEVNPDQYEVNENGKL